MSELIPIQQILKEYDSNEYSAELLLKHAIEHLKITQQQADQDRLRYKSACEISGDKHPEYVRGYEAAMDAVCKAQPAPIPTSERLAAGRILTCVYCGHEYPQDTPAHGSKVLTDHISQCEKHPMRDVIDQRDKLKSALAGLIGASDSAELRNMELIIRLSPAPAADKAAMLDAIHVLLNVAEQPTGLTLPPAPGGSDE